MKQMVLSLVAAICGIMISSTVQADPDEVTLKLAKSHYEKGNVAYNLGKFDEAVTWYTKAYEDWPVPDFLYNIAQSYRLARKCKEAQFAYERYLAVKEEDKGAPLGKDERAGIERFIKELTDCAATTKDDASALPPPDKPKPKSVPPDAPTPIPDTAKPMPITAAPRVAPPAASATAITETNIDAAVEPPDNDNPGISASTITDSKHVFIYTIGGVAPISADVRSRPPSFAAGAGYLLSIGSLTLDLGPRISYAPIHDTRTHRAFLGGILARLGTTYQVNSNFAVGGDIGIGVTLLRHLADDSAFNYPGGRLITTLSLRAGVTVEFAITPGLVAVFSPASLDFTPMSRVSLTQLDVLIGLGYRV